MLDVPYTIRNVTTGSPNSYSSLTLAFLRIVLSLFFWSLELRNSCTHTVTVRRKELERKANDMMRPCGEQTCSDYLISSPRGKTWTLLQPRIPSFMWRYTCGRRKHSKPQREHISDLVNATGTGLEMTFLMSRHVSIAYIALC
jgi:hypothetical protein